tara:strand:+ start:257 stop:361 length:105 start_codon:yes stop_codon:yes gene_type:complete
MNHFDNKIGFEANLHNLNLKKLNYNLDRLAFIDV